jgi:hypothetical protein
VRVEKRDRVPFAEGVVDRLALPRSEPQAPHQLEREDSGRGCSVAARCAGLAQLAPHLRVLPLIFSVESLGFAVLAKCARELEPAQLETHVPAQ